jgi:hypothetical protein
MRFLPVFLIFLFGCGADQKVKENPTTCKLTAVPDGVQFDCIDKDGKAYSEVVKNGPKGEQGLPGAEGEKGEAGKGLQVVYVAKCQGEVEAWMEGASYKIEVQYWQLETGDSILRTSNSLMRGSELLNQRMASGFFIGPEKIVSDGIFEYSYSGQSVKVSNKSKSTDLVIPCSESK